MSHWWLFHPLTKWSYEQNTLASKTGGLPTFLEIPKPPWQQYCPLPTGDTPHNPPRPGKRPSGDFSVPAFDWQMLHWPRFRACDPGAGGMGFWMGSAGEAPKISRSMMIQRICICIFTHLFQDASDGIIPAWQFCC